MSAHADEVLLSDPLVLEDVEVIYNTFSNDATPIKILEDVQIARGPSLGRDNECRICGEDILETDEAMTHPVCKTSFHLSCAADWVAPNLASNGEATCPLCRGKLAIKNRRHNEVSDLFYYLDQAMPKACLAIHTRFEYEWTQFAARMRHAGPESLQTELRATFRNVLLAARERYWTFIKTAGCNHFEYALMQLRDTDRPHLTIAEDMCTDIYELTYALIMSEYCKAADLFKSAISNGNVEGRQVELAIALCKEVEEGVTKDDLAFAAVECLGLKTQSGTLAELFQN